MIKPSLPMVVIGGYLGAGKTTLINRLLAEDHGRRLLVMVNDFGAINIDAHLLASVDEDTITLTNGCVCCTMGSDLFLAIGDVLDRTTRPDVLIVEASGIADPSAIAQAAIAEPELRYGGIVTVVDGLAISSLLQDELIAPQISAQVQCSDLLMLSKSGGGLALPILQELRMVTDAPLFDLADLNAIAPLILGHDHQSIKAGARAVHPQYAAWSYAGPARMDKANIQAMLTGRPNALFRVKGFIQETQDCTWEIHVVGQQSTITRARNSISSQIVALGLSDRIDMVAIERWFQKYAQGV